MTDTIRPSFGSSPPPVVYVVDDDLSVRESLEMLITAAGWRPAIFDTADSFLKAPPASTPSCLLLDVNMPDLNGLDLQRMVTTSGNRMPIIFISGYRDVPATVRALKAGAMDFLTKPINSAGCSRRSGRPLLAVTNSGRRTMLKRDCSGYTTL